MNKINVKNKKWTHLTLNIVVVAVIAFIGGMSFKNFFEGAGIIPTGISGLAMIIRNGIASLGLDLPVSVIYLIINLIIFAFAFKIMGWRFLLLSGIGMACYTLGMQFGNLSFIPIPNENEKLLYAVVGAMLGGLTVGIAVKFGGSTGGSDVAGIIINKYFPKIKTGYCFLLINIIVLTLSIIVGGLQTGLYALVVAVINSLTTNMILDGSKRVVAYYIICDKDEDIAKAILDKYHRGVTHLDATGMFSKKEKSLLLCLIPNEQADQMKKLVADIDHNAFVFSAPVTETVGNGNFMKEVSIFKNRIAKVESMIKTEEIYKRHKKVKKLKLKRKQKRFREPFVKKSK